MNERNENIEGTAETQACDLGVKTKVILTKNADFFGPGLFHLLQYIDEEGTIHAASKKMGMSYSKSWKIIKRAERELGYPLLSSHNGGTAGGKSELTEKGKWFLQQYREMAVNL